MRAPRALAVGLALLSAGCALGPKYKRPAAPVPPAYKEQLATETTAESWKAAEPQDAAHRGRWWEVFGDPELSALEDDVDLANQNIAQAEAAFRGARAAVRGARAELFPTVTASPSVTRSHGSANSVAASSNASAATITSYQLPIDLSYEADVWGRIRRDVEGSVASAQASAADLETVRLTMQAELAVDYFQLRGLDAQIHLLEQTVAAYEKALQLTINRHGQGVASGVDVAQAETQLYTTRAQAIDLAVGRAQLEHAIAILAGKPPGDFALAPSLAAYQPPPAPVGLPSELLERRPDIAASERRMAAANAQIGVAKAAFFPRLLLSATGGYESTKLTSLFALASRYWAIGPSLAATLFDGGQRRATREAAQAAYDGAVAGYRQTVLSAFQDVEDNLAALNILASESTQQTAAVGAAERSLALSMNRYQAGITTYLEVITAQSAALTNEIAAVNTLTRRMTASVNLIKALGGGWHEPSPWPLRPSTAGSSPGAQP